MSENKEFPVFILKNCHRQLTEALDWTVWDPEGNSQVVYIPKYVDLVTDFIKEAMSTIPFPAAGKDKSVNQYCLEVFELLVSLVIENFDGSAACVLFKKVGKKAREN